MPIGPYVRRAFGPWEHALADAYRRFFIDLDEFATALHSRIAAENIVEVGCGEGALAERVAERYTESKIIGIDVAEGTGRLFQGDRDRVTFQREPVAAFSKTHRAAFDLAIVCDVLHHVPWDEHRSFLGATATLVRPGGVLVLKDWDRRPTLRHMLCYASDRWLTGDRIRYATAEQLRELLAQALPLARVSEEFRVPPSSHNIAIVMNIG